MAALSSSALDFEAHPVVGVIGIIRLRVSVMVRVSVRAILSSALDFEPHPVQGVIMV